MTPELKFPYASSTIQRCLALAALLLPVAACSTSTLEDAGNGTEKRVFSVALENLSERYIEPIHAGHLMVNGLSRLASIDDRLAVLRRDGSIAVTFDGHPVAEYPAPELDHIGKWSSLGAIILRDARSASPTIEAQSSEEIYRSVLPGFISGLDRYSRYLSPEDARRSRATRDGFGGIGITLEVVDGEFVIRQILTDQPAAEAGLMTNDRITHIDGKSLLGLPLKEVINLLRGDIGDAVRLTVTRENTPALLIKNVVRDHIVPPSVTARQKEGILEIELSIFNQGTVGAIRKAIVKAVREKGSGLKGIVLDLRNNPGGLLDQAISVADLFLNRGRIVSTEGRHADSNQVFDATPGQMLEGMPLVVLINGRSASATEIVAVALRDSGRAAIVGSSSYGKGTVQTIIRLPNRGEMNVTWARIVAPTGQTLASQGIVPAICTNLPAEALEILRSQLKNAGRTPEITNRPVFAAQARLPHYSSVRRAACPPSKIAQDGDMEIARLVLANRRVYAAAVAHPAPNIAKR